ncbi:Hypothetical predicted protein [Pelobates cultripes]|uniref:Uncharacterized protein n=1 Tax=Pelobates cultripes TaxID=61616 RepID=A0AAD1S043_PELCU|nr:Hypothetical predicted protein [Pelobates cultripes]
MIFYRPFIDDVFIIWRGDLESITSMVNLINEAPTPIKLTMTASPTEVDFLDVHIYKNQSKLAYTLYTKPTDRNTVLKADSFHLKPFKESLPLSQIMRVVPNNSDPVNTQKQIKEMWT